MESPQAQDLILGRYRPIETAGEGGSGTVEICWDSRIQRRVAIKRIQLNDAGPLSGEGIPGLAEARTAALLKHPAIVDLIDFEALEDEAFLIMEAVEGPSLSEIIDDTQPGELDLDIITTITEAMASALDFAHENGVLHLDIKPDNVLIDMSGRPKISDFGIAELADAQGFGQACGGTIGYMPPEQMSLQDLDQRCDMFAFASCIYEMLTGTNPFFAKDIDSSLRKIETFNIDNPSDLRDDIDPGIDDVLFCAMEPDRDNRYDTIADFMSEVKPYLGSAKAGQKILREAINPTDDEEEDNTQEQKNGIWKRFNSKTTRIFGRVLSGILAWWIGFILINGSELVSFPLTFVFSLIPALLGFCLPSICAGLLLVALGALCIYAQNVPSWLCVLMFIPAPIWWAFVARRNFSAVNSVLLAPIAALIGFTQIIPLLCGLYQKPVKAAVSAATAGLFVVVLGIVTNNNTIFLVQPFIDTSAQLEELAKTFFCTPETWITLASWVLASLVMSTICNIAMSPTKFVCILGAVLGSAITFCSQILIQWLCAGECMVPNTQFCVAQSLALICTIIICILGVPRQDREE